eukprot:sb/3478293/
MLAAYHLKGHIARIVGNVGKDKERTLTIRSNEIRLSHDERPSDPVYIPMVYEQTTGITKSPEQLMPNDPMAQKISEHFKLVNSICIDQGMRVFSLTLLWESR